MAFKWNFPLMGSYWTGSRHPAAAHRQGPGGMDKLKGKKVTLVYHDSPFGKEPIPLLQERAKMHGFDLQMLPVTAPWRRTEGHLAAGAPEPPRLRAAVGLGCDELHRPEGSPGHGLSTRQDVWRVVGRCRA
jgi:hypothetical protein